MVAAVKVVALTAATWLLTAPTAKAAEPFTDQRQLGTKYSPLAQINTKNVGDLQLAWEYHTGETNTAKSSLDAFEDEPSLKQ
jgi:quinoprotein glucose dehydrogenase